MEGVEQSYVEDKESMVAHDTVARTRDVTAVA